MINKEPNIKDETDLKIWIEQWAKHNSIPTVKREDDSYVDASLNCVYRAMLDHYTPKFNNIAHSKRKKVDDHLTVNSLIHILEEKPENKLSLYSPVADEDESGGVILVFKKTPRNVDCSYLEMWQALCYLKGCTFRNPEYNKLTVKGSTLLYVERFHYDYSGEGESYTTVEPLRRSMVVPYGDGWE